MSMNRILTNLCHLKLEIPLMTHRIDSGTMSCWRAPLLKNSRLAFLCSSQSINSGDDLSRCQGISCDRFCTDSTALNCVTIRLVFHASGQRIQAL